MKLNFKPVIDNLELVASSVKENIINWQGYTAVKDIWVTEIDPKYMGGINLCKHYGISPNEGANCVIIEVVRGENKNLAACLIPVSCNRTDFNGVVRRHFNARRVSLASLDDILKQTNMEYGSITVFGLPKSWPILIDPSIVSKDRIIIGAGLQKSKLSLPGKTLLELPNSCVVKGLCKMTR